MKKIMTIIFCLMTIIALVSCSSSDNSKILQVQYEKEESKDSNLEPYAGNNIIFDDRLEKENVNASNQKTEIEYKSNETESIEVDELNLKEKQYRNYVGLRDFDRIELNYIYVLDPDNYQIPKILKPGDSFGSLILDEVHISDMYISNDYFYPSQVFASFSGEFEVTGDLTIQISTLEHYFVSYIRVKSYSTLLPIVYGPYENYGYLRFYVNNDDLYELLGIDYDETNMDYCVTYEYSNVTLKCNEYWLYRGETEGGNRIESVESISNITTPKITGYTSDYDYTVNSDDTVTIDRYTGEDEYVVIPSEIDGKKVVAIGNTSSEIGAFENRTSITSIFIEDGIMEIQDNAFRGCKNLFSVVIPKSVIYIGKGVFNDCDLGNVYFEGDAPRVDDNNIFYFKDRIRLYCRYGTSGWDENSGRDSWYEEITPERYFSTVDYYYKITKKNTVVIIKYIGKEGDIIVPSEIDGMKVCEIEYFGGGEVAFYNGNPLTSIVIQEGITIIQHDAFRYCSTLSSVTIPASVKFIGHNVFYTCDNLKSVYFEGDVPSSMGRGIFPYIETLTLYYREGKDGWTNLFYGTKTLPY